VKLVEALRDVLEAIRCRHEFTPWVKRSLNTRTRKGEFWQRTCTKCKTRFTAKDEPFA
jgi:PHP family Zn ribbon phosphoesterase